MFAKIKNKYSELSKPLKATIWFTFSVFLQKGIYILSTPIYTRLLDKEEYGYFSVYQSWFDILLIIATLNLSGGVMNNALNKCKKEEDKNKVLSNFQILELFTIVIALFVVISLNFYNANIFGMPNHIIVLLFVQILANSGMSLWMTKERFDFNYRWPVIISLVTTALNLGLGVLFIKYGDNRMYSLIYGAVFSCLIPYGLLVFLNIINGKFRMSLKLWKYALKFNIPLLPHYLSLVILGMADRIMIERFCGLTDTSLYTVAYNIAKAINLFCTGISIVLTPWIYKKMNEEKYGDIKRVSTIIMISLTIICFMIMIFGPEALYILGGNAYVEAKNVIPPVIVGLFFMFLYPLYGTIEFYYEKNIYTMIASVIAAASNIALNFVFIPKFGYVAAAYTTLVCYMLLAIFHLFAYKIILNKKEVYSIYSDKIIALLSLLVLMLIPFMYLLYLNNIVRYLAIAAIIVILIIILINYKNIISYVKKKNTNSEVRENVNVNINLINDINEEYKVESKNGK